MWKWMGLFLRKNYLLRWWGWLSLLNWIGALSYSLFLKLPPRKLEPWFILWSLFLLRLLCTSINLTIRPCMEYCCHVRAGAPSCYFELLDKLQKRISRTAVPSLAASHVANLSLFYRYFFDSCSSELAELVPLPYSWERSTRYSDILQDFSVAIPRCGKDVYPISFFPRTVTLWNSLPIECFPLTYDLSGFNSRIYTNLLTVSSF